MKKKSNLSIISIAVVISLVIIGIAGAAVAGYYYLNRSEEDGIVTEDGKKLSLINDSPKIKTFNDKSYIADQGWWLRYDNEYVEFAFENVDVENLKDDQLTLVLNLGVTNRIDGEENLDGLVDIMINPYDGQNSINYMNVILENVNRGSKSVGMFGGGSYVTKYQGTIDKKYVNNGTLVIRVMRYKDDNKAPDAKGKLGKIEIVQEENGMAELDYASGIFENEEPHTVHLNVPTLPGEKDKARPGVAVLYGYL